MSYNLQHRFNYVFHFIVKETEVLRKLSNLLMTTQLVSARTQTRTYDDLSPELECLTIAL